MRYAFNNATSLREVTFEPGSRLEMIRQGAFMDATSLQTIQIPASVIDIRDLAFTNTQSLREITFEQNSQIGYIGINNTFSRSGLTKVAIGESALNRLNIDRQAHNLPPLRFGENNYFYGKSNVKIVSRAQQINRFAMISRKPVYEKPSFFGRLLGKPPKKTRSALPPELATEIGRYLMPAGVEPKSPAVLAARAAAANATAGGARKSRKRKRGIRRLSRKAPSTRKIKKRKSKRRRTTKRR
jgi:hypothetical protein